jgi:hypothetical protein
MQVQRTNEPNLMLNVAAILDTAVYDRTYDAVLP